MNIRESVCASSGRKASAFSMSAFGEVAVCAGSWLSLSCGAPGHATLAAPVGASRIAPATAPFEIALDIASFKATPVIAAFEIALATALFKAASFDEVSAGASDRPVLVSVYTFASVLGVLEPVAGNDGALIRWPIGDVINLTNELTAVFRSPKGPARAPLDAPGSGAGTFSARASSRGGFSGGEHFFLFTDRLSCGFLSFISQLKPNFIYSSPCFPGLLVSFPGAHPKRKRKMAHAVAPSELPARRALLCARFLPGSAFPWPLSAAA